MSTNLISFFPFTAVSQDERILNSSLFNDFLLNAQQETLNATRESVKLDILLADNSRINCALMLTDNSNAIKETICRELKLPIKYTPYFSLFIAKEIVVRPADGRISHRNSLTNNGRNHSSFLLAEKSDKFINGSSNSRQHQANNRSTDCKYVLIRKMMDFEAPLLSLANANQTSAIYYLKLIKFYWDTDLDDKLVENEVALNLIYLQAVGDFERQSTELNKDHYQYLESLALRQSKKEVSFC